jgi:hypothetical protein
VSNFYKECEKNELSDGLKYLCLAYTERGLITLSCTQGCSVRNLTPRGYEFLNWVLPFGGKNIVFQASSVELLCFEHHTHIH